MSRAPTRQVNVVVMRGVNDDELADFVELTRGARINVRFIEYMPFDGNVWSEPKLVPYAAMLAAVHARYPQGLERCAVRPCCAAPRSAGRVALPMGAWCRAASCMVSPDVVARKGQMQLGAKPV